MERTKLRYKPQAFTVSDEEIATIEQYAKDQGYPSLSSTLRRIIWEWKQLKAEQLVAGAGNG